jgi:hypothetical protein
LITSIKVTLLDSPLCLTPADTPPQDKLGYSTKRPTLFLVNALAFMLVFFLARIVYGGYNVRPPSRGWIVSESSVHLSLR